MFFDFEALKNWDRPGTWLSVVGYPVRHSLSPPMHRAALAVIGRSHPEFAGWDYVGFEIPPEQFVEALPLFFNKGFYGLNLTLPHKVEALQLVSEIDPEATRMGAVNTLVRYDDGYHGYNTDGYGLRSGMRSELGTSCRDRDVILLGAGGASRAAAIQCLKDGCRSLWIGNRSPERLQSLIEAVNGALGGAVANPFNLMDPPKGLPSAPILINATSLGLKDTDPLPIDLRRFEAGTCVYDMIYNPAETPIVRQAKELGFSAATGLSMLVFQGARSLEIWTQVPVSVPAMSDAAQSALKLR